MIRRMTHVQKPFEWAVDSLVLRQESSTVRRDLSIPTIDNITRHESEMLGTSIYSAPLSSLLGLNASVTPAYLGIQPEAC